MSHTKKSGPGEKTDCRPGEVNVQVSTQYLDDEETSKYY